MFVTIRSNLEMNFSTNSLLFDHPDTEIPLWIDSLNSNSDWWTFRKEARGKILRERFIGMKESVRTLSVCLSGGSDRFVEKLFLKISRNLEPTRVSFKNGKPAMNAAEWDDRSRMHHARQARNSFRDFPADVRRCRG